MFPPMLLHLRFGTPERPGFGLWLPLFLVWLLLLPIVVLVLVATMVVDVVLFFTGQSYYHYTLLLLNTLGLVGALSGMLIRIRSKEDVVEIDFV